jgi:hypothetical protein
VAFTNNQYCALADVKTALDLQKTTNDSWINTLIGEAQQDIDEYIGYPFQTDGTVSVPATRVYDGNDQERLFTDHYLSFSKVEEDGRNITPDCYALPRNQTAKGRPFYMIGRLSGSLFSQGPYVVTGVFGYPSIPTPITRACVRLTVHYYKMRDTNYADFLAEQGAVRQKYSKEMPIDVIEILDKYKHRMVLCQ